MLKRSITYTDYNGVERTEDFYFNLNQAELSEMQLSQNGGMDNLILKIINTSDTAKLIEIFKEIILKSYGEKSNDGKRFIKKDENGHPLYRQFEETEAYSNLFMELATDDKKAAEFVNGILPKDLKISQSDLEKYKNELNLKEDQK